MVEGAVDATLGPAMSETLETQRRRRPGRTLDRVLLALLLVVGVVVFAEVASRWLVPDPSVHLGFARDRVIEPYTMFGAGRSDTGLNELGYRGPAPTMPKPADEIRVVVLGGSTVFLGNPSVPELLEGELQARGLDRVRVYNFGVVASVSEMELARLVHEVLDLEPDLVVMYNGANDITAPVLYDPRPGYPANFYVVESNPFLNEDFSLAGWLLSRSHLARILVPRQIEESLFPVATLRENAGWGSEAWRTEIADIYVGNVEKADAISRGRSAEFAAILQPMLYFKSERTEKEESGAEFILGMVSYAAPRSWQESDGAATLEAHSRDVRGRIRQRAEALPPGTTFVDLSDFFADDETVFLDFVHVEQAVKPRLAAAIADELLLRPEIAGRLAGRSERATQSASPPSGSTLSPSPDADPASAEADSSNAESR